MKAHLSSLQKERYKVQSDLSFHFIRSLFLDNVLENPIITQAILSNQIVTLADFENFTRITYTARFEQVIDHLKLKVQQQKQGKGATVLNAEETDKGDTTAEGGKVEQEGAELDEQQVVKQAIQTLLEQYVHLFQRAKIFEIRKLSKMMKQIANYVTGFIMKKATTPPSNKSLSSIL